MNVLSEFEKLALVPFCSKEDLIGFANILPCESDRKFFLNGNQLQLRKCFSKDGAKNFPDVVDVVML